MSYYILLKFNIHNLGNGTATSNSTQIQYPPIVHLDQLSRTVSDIVSGGQFSINIRSMPSQQLLNNRTLPTTTNIPSATTLPNNKTIDKEKFMKQHLLLMLHAKKCIHRDEEGGSQSNDKIKVSQNKLDFSKKIRFLSEIILN